MQGKITYINTFRTKFYICYFGICFQFLLNIILLGLIVSDIFKTGGENLQDDYSVSLGYSLLIYVWQSKYFNKCFQFASCTCTSPCFQIAGKALPHVFLCLSEEMRSVCNELRYRPFQVKVFNCQKCVFLRPFFFFFFFFSPMMNRNYCDIGYLLTWVSV